MTVSVVNVSRTGHHDSSRTQVNIGERMGVSLNGNWVRTGSVPLIMFCDASRYCYAPENLNSGASAPDANGFRDATGGQFQILTHQTTAQPEPGKWTLRWEGDCDEVTWGTQGAGQDLYHNAVDDDIVVGVSGEKTFTVPDGLTPAIWTSVIANGTLTSFNLIAPGQVTRFDAGNIVHSSYVSYFQGIDYWRTMNPQQINGSPVRNYADIAGYNNMGWGWLQNDVVGTGNNGASSMPGRALAEVVNELGCGLYLNVGHQMTTAALQTWLAEINTYINPGTSVIIETSNETWNNAGGFTDQYTWYSNADATIHEGTIDPATGLVTKVAHGLTTGVKINCYNNVYQNWSGDVAVQPRSGLSHYVEKITNDTFKIVREGPALAAGFKGYFTVVGVSADNPCQITTDIDHQRATGDRVSFIDVGGSTELNAETYTITVTGAQTFTLDGIDGATLTTFTSGGRGFTTVDSMNSTVTFARWTIQNEAVNSRNENYALRCIEVWGLARQYLSNCTIKRLIGCQHGSSGALSGILTANAEVARQYDYWSPAPYSKLVDFAKGGLIDSITPGTTTTITMINDHDLQAGDTVYFTSVSANGGIGSVINSDPGGNGADVPFTVQTVPSAKVVTIDADTDGLSYTSVTQDRMYGITNYGTDYAAATAKFSERFVSGDDSNYDEAYWDANCAVADNVRAYCYEGGHGDPQQAMPPAVHTWMNNWRLSSAAGDWYLHYYGYYAKRGCFGLTQYKDAAIDWGLLHEMDVPTGKQTGFRTMLDAGGASPI